MALAVPGLRGLFICLQLAMTSDPAPHRIRLDRGVHDTIADITLIAKDLAARPTRLYELVPLEPNVAGAHDASGLGAGGVILPSASTTTRQPNVPAPHPVVWRMGFPSSINRQLASFNNPKGKITNSDLELAGSLLHHEASVQNFDLRERTILSSTDNTPTLYWQRKGSVTTNGPAAYLLRAQAIHQRHHRYVPRHDFLAGDRNLMADDASRLMHLTDDQLLTYFNTRYPQPNTWKIWTVPPNFRSAVISALHRKPCKPELLLNDPPPPTATGIGGMTSAPHWPSIPYSATSTTQSLTSKCLPSDTETEQSLPVETMSGLAQLKTSYGRLDKRLAVWGP